MSTALPKFALLIDADNVSPDVLAKVIEEIQALGQLVVRRIYGDWSQPSLSCWKEQIHLYAVEPIQQFAYSKGKNSTDMALTIDAMDLLYKQQLDGFCLLSSDCDFTPLALRIKKQGLICYGFGRPHTAEAFQQACDEFYTVHVQTIAPEAPQLTMPSSTKTPKKIIPILQQAIGEAAQARPDLDGWATLSAIAVQVRQIYPDFSHKDYGCSTFGKLMEKHQSHFKFKAEGGLNYVMNR